eukprot:74232-Amphidinium_carterae.1
MSDTSPSYVPLLLQRSWSGRSEGLEELRTLHWKCYAYETGSCAWEIRRVFHTVLGDQGKDVHKLLWTWGYFVDVFDRCLSTTAEVIPSAQSYASLPDKWCTPHWSVRQEYTITTAGLIVVLLEWSRKRKKKIERSRASDALHQWMQSIVVVSELRDMLRESLVEGSGECTCDCNDIGLCAHCQSVWSASESMEPSSLLACMAALQERAQVFYPPQIP